MEIEIGYYFWKFLSEMVLDWQPFYIEILFLKTIPTVLGIAVKDKMQGHSFLWLEIFGGFGGPTKKRWTRSLDQWLNSNTDMYSKNGKRSSKSAQARKTESPGFCLGPVKFQRLAAQQAFDNFVACTNN